MLEKVDWRKAETSIPISLDDRAAAVDAAVPWSVFAREALQQIGS
jgi:hypothetical protein